MLVKATRTMLSELKKENEKRNTGYNFRFVTMDQGTYQGLVDYDLFRNEQDYSIRTGKFSVIAVEYPPEMYCSARYLTTNDLSRCFRYSNKTYEGFMEEVFSEIEI